MWKLALGFTLTKQANFLLCRKRSINSPRFTSDSPSL
jgi:hypothetical protein